MKTTVKNRGSKIFEMEINKILLNYIVVKEEYSIKNFYLKSLELRKSKIIKPVNCKEISLKESIGESLESAVREVLNKKSFKVKNIGLDNINATIYEDEADFAVLELKI
ncbi:hypothetical protein SAMN02745245_01296 [Anaerosphaera aminiphila DSM 21120]|uniref:Uncharacterized protein n=1 Tax=Anaerosphaera aminiphila DSM 21120 TaxID=1120995 RepID=A0A1M5STT8_9FIRM|nr:hypothetical protein [Anaerosphaera aminiphila]SHH41961.1 hypothetical protein SAMN02745245_01296 [Anaerosphaera aminiphila DSM 21120]